VRIFNCRYSVLRTDTDRGGVRPVRGTPLYGKFAYCSPPLKKKNFATVREPAKSPPTVHSNFSEAVCLAARTSGQRSAFLRSVVIFVKYREVRYCQIPSTSLQRQRCTRVLAATAGGVVKGERKKRTSSIWFSWPTKAILHGNQKGPCV